jgi:hypothetical protein
MYFLKLSTPDDEYTKDFMLLIGLMASQIWFSEKDLNLGVQEEDTLIHEKVLLL